jgi:membrane-bound lytic murein transglycosylase D
MATRAAARHLRDLYHEFGDWYLAIAAYNCGQGNVDRAVSKTGYADVWELRSRGTLPLETSNYVPIILAMTIMSKNPANYGIDAIIPDEPLLYDSVELHSLTSLALISDVLGLPVSELKEYNPALLRDFAPAGYKLHIPRGTGPALISGLELVPAERRASWRLHRAHDGETFASLATRYRTQIPSLQSANPAATGLESLPPGSLVVIPTAPQPVFTAKGKSRSSYRTAAKRPAARAKTRTGSAAKPAARRAAPAATAARAAAPRRRG